MSQLSPLSLFPNSILSHISLPPLYPPHSPLSLISLQSHLSLLSSPLTSLLFTSLYLLPYPLSHITIPSLLSQLSPVSQLFPSLSLLCLRSRLSHFSHLSQHPSPLSPITPLYFLSYHNYRLSHTFSHKKIYNIQNTLFTMNVFSDIDFE